MNLFDLTGKKALVTGGGRGIGLALAKGLHAAGVRVAILDVAENVQDVAAAELGPDGVGVRVDLMDRDASRLAFQEAVDRLGGLDILINNAGMQFKHDFLGYPLERWDRILELNLSCAFRLIVGVFF